MGLLSDILANKRSELPRLRARLRNLAAPSTHSPRSVDLRRGADGQLKLITELKRRSPSAGELSRVLDVEQRVQQYSRYGATLISVLCDERYFDGDYQHLQRARQACQTPLLCKEFIIDECQLDAAVAYGADAVLLIVRCLARAQLRDLLQAALGRGLLPLVEVFDANEAQQALSAGANVIGVNARDLDTLEMDAERARRVLEQLPATVTRVHLSGVKTAADVRRVRQSPADAALIGEVLMKQDDPGPLLRELSHAASFELDE